MKLITLSAKPITQDLSAEFGHILPAFLPIKNKPIIQWHSDIPHSEHYITIDFEYKLSSYEQYILKESNVKVIRVSAQNNIISAFNDVKIYFSNDPKTKAEESIRIIYGDTIISEIDRYIKQDKMIVGTTKIPDDGNWHKINDSNLTFAGFFQFPLNILDTITERAQNDSQLFYELTNNPQLEMITLEGSLDLGRSHTYHANKLKFSTTRHFNQTEFNKYKFKKIGATDKMRAEAEWFLNINSELKPYTPHIYTSHGNTDKGSYEIETLYDSDLADILIHGRIRQATINEIFSEIREFLKKCWSSKQLDSVEIQKIFNLKLKNRFETSEMQNFLQITNQIENGKKLYKHYNQKNKEVIRRTDTVCISHGDFCFSNIMYNFKKKTIKVIDPRGKTLDDREISIYGPKIYDLLKLGHSAIYGYDLAIRGMKKTEFIDAPNRAELERQFWEIANNCEEQYSKSEIKLGIGNLFFTMIPLHSDNISRQRIFFKIAEEIIGDI